MGGVSQEPYNSLNLAFQVGDKSEAVIENRRLLAKLLNFNISALTFTQQVHGENVSWIDKDLAGAGNRSSGLAVSETDAMITNVDDVGLAVLCADCLPIILIDPVKKISAAIHAGWRGTLNKIAAKAVTEMIKGGAAVSRIQAFLGPAIGECCYEVGLELFEQFSSVFQLAAVPNKPHLNLSGINETILLSSGLLPHNVRSMNLCTSCRPDLFYSWRRDGQTGRQGALVIRPSSL